MHNRERFTTAQKKMMLLSQQTLEGLRITSMTFPFYATTINLFIYYVVASFTEMTPLLLGLPGVTCFFSEKLCQDPVESFLASIELVEEDQTILQ